MFVAATKYRGLRMFANRPKRNIATLGWDDETGQYININDSYFPDLTWEDEPVEVDIKFK